MSNVESNGDLTILCNAAGRPRVMIINQPDTPLVVLYGRDGQAAGVVSFSDADDALTLTLLSSDGTPRAAVQIADGEPVLAAIDREGRLQHVRHALGQSPETSPFTISPN